MKAIHFLSFLLITASTFNLTAQIIYESNDYAGIGDSFIVSHVSSGLSGNEFETLGVDTTWDFSQLQPNSQEIVFYSNPNNTGFQAPYILICNLGCFNPCVANCVSGGTSNTLCQGICAATCGANCFGTWNDLFDLAEQTNDSTTLSIINLTDIYNFYQKKSNALNQVAIGAQVQGFPVIMGNDNLDRVYKFPLNYGDTDVSISDYGIGLDSIPGTGIVTSITYKHAQTRSTTVEGWGELTTPFMHFDSVLKLKAVIHNRDTIIFQGDTLYLQNILPPSILPDSIVTFSWLSKDFGYPVFSLTASLINGQLTNREASFIDTIRCFDPVALFGYLPIPATIAEGEDSVEVNFFSQTVNANVINWNFDDPISGTSNTAQGSNPSHWFTVDGTYNVQLEACNVGCSTIVCDTFSIPVIVIDNNPDAIKPVDKLSDLTIFPNPFTNQLELKYPASQSIGRVELFDLQGKKWLDIELPSSSTSGNLLITTDQIPQNLYFIKVTVGKKSYTQKVLKFN